MIMVMISNPDVIFGRYRRIIATAAARASTMRVAAAPTSTDSGVISTEDESRQEGPPTSGRIGQGVQPPPEGTVLLLRLEEMLIGSLP
jgi:hypothetical protein